MTWQHCCIEKVGHHVPDIVCITLTNLLQHPGFLPSVYATQRICQGDFLFSKLGAPQCGTLHAPSCPTDCTGLNCKLDSAHYFYLSLISS